MFRAMYLISVVSFFISATCSFLISKLAHRFGMIDNPNERSSHSTAMPKGGGAGIWVAFLIVGFLLVERDYRLLVYIVGCIGLLGLINDRFEISSKLRLLFQLILSAAIVAAYANISFYVYSSSLLINLFFFLFFVIFISGTANFYNFMDGINGMASLTGIVSFGLLAVFSSFLMSNDYIVLMSLALSSACLGFLPLNFPNARVFMGDVGSLLLGFIFASFVVKLSADISIFLCLSMFLCTFYADALVTIYHRWRKGENLTKAHRSHLYQYLSNELGIAQWKVSLIYALVQLLFGILAILAYRKGVILQLTVITIFGALFLIAYHKVRALGPVIQTTK